MVEIKTKYRKKNTFGRALARIRSEIEKNILDKTTEIYCIKPLKLGNWSNFAQSSLFEPKFDLMKMKANH